MRHQIAKIYIWFLLSNMCEGQSSEPFLRVACRAGLPPFSNVVNGSCVGIMADLFSMIAKTADFNYTITPINYVATLAVTVNGTTNTSPFDIAISFNTITADRMQIVDFSLPIGEFSLAAMLNPKYSKKGINLIDALTGNTILYLLCVKALIIFCGSIIIFFSEHFLTQHSELKQIESISERVLICLETTFQVILQLVLFWF